MDVRILDGLQAGQWYFLIGCDPVITIRELWYAKPERRGQWCRLLT